MVVVVGRCSDTADALATVGSPDVQAEPNNAIAATRTVSARQVRFVTARVEMARVGVDGTASA